MSEFSFVEATTKELKDKCFRLRYEIYTEEFGFEPVNDSKLEIDEHDDNSIHFGAIENEKVIGTIRLIKDNFPVNDIVDFSDYILNSKCAEVSRFAVSKSKRKINGREISYSLMKCITRKCLELKIETMLMVLDPTIFESLCKLGIIFEDIHEQVNYHGPRIPCAIVIKNNDFMKFI